MKQLTIACGLFLASGLAVAETGSDIDMRIAEAATGDHRSEQNRDRNRYRNPVETLKFFGIEDGMTVMEIWPGGGWYTEVLAPAIRDHGTFIVANWDPDVEGQPDYRYRLPKELDDKFAARPDLYDQVKTVHYSPPESDSLGEADSVDLLVTFRNTHGWMNSGMAEDVYAEFFRVVKPGGTLGVVQHRAAPGTPLDEALAKGYVPEDDLVALIEGVGFELVERSEVNANPLDTHDHPEGVWTLPPSLRLGDVDRDKYLAIGESDRMTLKFVKPDA